MLSTACGLLAGLALAAGAPEAPAAKQSFLLAGGYPGLSNLHGLIMKSTDGGKTWRETWFKDKDGNTIFNIVHVPEVGKIFAMGRVGILASTNGDEWKPVSMPEGFEVLDLAYGDGMLLAVGPGTTFLYSTDKGETWQSVMHDAKGKYVNELFKEWNGKIGPVGKRHYRGVLFHKGHFIVTGSHMVAIYLAPKDGKPTFVKELKNEESALKVGEKIVSDGKGQLFIFGDNVTYRSTDDGETFSIVRGLKKKSGFDWGAYSNGTWIGCGSFGTIKRSTDGKKWEDAQGQPTRGATYYSCTGGGGKFYAAMRDDEYAVSDDGLKWSKVQAQHHPDNEEQYLIRFYVVRPIEL